MHQLALLFSCRLETRKQNLVEKKSAYIMIWMKYLKDYLKMISYYCYDKLVRFFSLEGKINTNCDCHIKVLSFPCFSNVDKYF